MSEWDLIKSFYCINLDKNPGRWEGSVDEFLKVGLSYVEQIVTHESEENRYLSFNHAHYDTIRKGYETGEPFCVFEDDIEFDKTWKHLAEASKQLPDDWDILFLGANIIGTDVTIWDMPLSYSKHLVRLLNCWQTHSIVYSNKAAKWILDNFDPDTFPVFDEWLRVNAMPNKNVFLIKPMICFQRPVYSDLWQRQTDYTGAHLQGNVYLKLHT